MGVNLVKGQKVNLQKSDGGTLKRVVVGLGWDEAQPQKSGGLFGSLFGSTKTQNIDCDASAFLCVGGKVISSSERQFRGSSAYGRQSDRRRRRRRRTDYC